VLQRNPRYADGRAAMPFLGHLAHLDRLVFQGYATKQEELAALKAGEIAAALDLNERDLDTAAAIGENLLVVPSLSYEQVTLNRADPLFKDDPRLVDALMLGAGRTAVIRDVLHGRVSAAESPLSPAISWVPTPAPLRLDAGAARQELDGDGWIAGPDGIRKRDGKPLAFTLMTTADSPLRAAEAEALAGSWRQLGADVRLQGAPPDVLFGPPSRAGSLARGGYQAGLWAWNTSPDPDGLRGLFASGSPANYARCASPEMDGALASGAASLDRGKRSAAYQALAAAYQSARCETPLFWRLDVGLAARHLHNFAPNPSAAGNTWNVADWWVG
jgi:peptide/nickel transport system substrate-binding protein